MQLFSLLVFGTWLAGASGEDPAVESRIRGAFFGALVADALTLGSHYESMLRSSSRHMEAPFRNIWVQESKWEAQPMGLVGAEGTIILARRLAIKQTMENITCSFWST
jgi:hypothetical protein